MQAAGPRRQATLLLVRLVCIHAAKDVMEVSAQVTKVLLFKRRQKTLVSEVGVVNWTSLVIGRVSLTHTQEHMYSMPHDHTNQLGLLFQVNATQWQ